MNKGRFSWFSDYKVFDQHFSVDDEIRRQQEEQFWDILVGQYKLDGWVSIKESGDTLNNLNLCFLKGTHYMVHVGSIFISHPSLATFRIEPWKALNMVLWAWVLELVFFYNHLFI